MIPGMQELSMGEQETVRRIGRAELDVASWPVKKGPLYPSLAEVDVHDFSGVSVPAVAALEWPRGDVPPAGEPLTGDALARALRVTGGC